MGDFIILDNSKRWDEAYASLPLSLQDIYYTTNYYRIYEKNTNSKAVCYIFSEEKNIFLYPFLLTEIDKKYLSSSSPFFDIEGAYGYNGPLVFGNDPNFIEKATRLFSEKCIQNNIIAEFTRFNPILKNNSWANYMQVTCTNQNVVLDLSINDIWRDAYEHSTRKNINKAQRSGLTVYYVSGKNISKEEMAAFLDIYYDTMKRNNAQSEYYFSGNYFNDITQFIPANSYFFFTVFENKMVSCELVLVGREIGYSFLGGTLADYFSMRANDILKHHIILTLKQMGIKYFCFGGGTKINDGIFKYKKCFAKNGVVDFFIGKKIHNEKIYQQVIEKWKALFPEKEELYKNHLLKYKY